MDEKTDEVAPILARPTVHLPGGLKPGFVYWVDPTSEYVKRALREKRLVRVKE